MSQFWRLRVRRPLGDDELFDLRAQRKVFVGDSPTNDVCIRTLEIPARLKMLRRSFTKNKLLIRLSNEIVSTLEGQFKETKPWKAAPLYSGKEFEVLEAAKWKVADVQFEVMRVDEVKLSPFKIELDPLEKKQKWQSTGLTMVAHAVLLLMIFLLGLLPAFKFVRDQQIQEVSLKKVQELFRKEEVKPLPEPTTPRPEDRPKEAIKQVATKTPVPHQKSAGKKAGNRPRKIDSMGLLAIQTVNRHLSSGHTVMKVAAPQAQKRPNAKEFETSLGTGSADYGVGSGKEGVGMAKLEGIHGQTYQGGLGKGVAMKKGPSIKLARREIEIRGGLDPAVIREIIEERLSEIRYCYETALLKQQNLEGKISAKWTILADGSVSEISSASDDISQAVLHSCLRTRISGWKFPSPKGGGVVHVKYPFIFSPLGG